MLILDGDMIFPKDTLEKLRSRDLPFLSGTYLRRTYAPPAPVWFEDGNTFPYRPWTKPFEEGKLYKVGASGWGCIYIKREVVEAVKPFLKGEQFVLEDDMDVYPYDLARVMLAIDTLENLSSKDVPAKALADYVRILREEIRPLRGVKDMIGSDLRFPFFAKLAGYDLYLDTSVLCGHMLNYKLQPTDFITMPKATIIGQDNAMQTGWNGEKERLGNKLKDLQIANIARADSPEDVTPQGTDEREQVNDALHREQGGEA